MSATTSLLFDIRFVTDVTLTADGLEILFRDGTTALIEAAHSNFTTLRCYAENNCGRPVPMGVILAPNGRVVDLHSAHDTTVRLVRPFPNDPDRIEVWFWGYSPVCGLLRAHPEFDRIHATLTEAVETRESLWVAVFSEERVEDGPDEEGCTVELLKLMDVRPIPVPASSEHPAPSRVTGASAPQPTSAHDAATR